MRKVKFMTENEVAESLRVSNKYLREMVHKGLAPPFIISDQQILFEITEFRKWMRDKAEQCKEFMTNCAS